MFTSHRAAIHHLEVDRPVSKGPWTVKSSERCGRYSIWYWCSMVRLISARLASWLRRSTHNHSPWIRIPASVRRIWTSDDSNRDETVYSAFVDFNHEFSVRIMRWIVWKTCKTSDHQNDLWGDLGAKLLLSCLEQCLDYRPFNIVICICIWSGTHNTSDPVNERE